MTTCNSIPFIGIENSIERLALPASHPAAYALEVRRVQFLNISRAIDDLYTHSVIDAFVHMQLSHRAELAYIYGGSL